MDHRLLMVSIMRRFGPQFLRTSIAVRLGKNIRLPSCEIFRKARLLNNNGNCDQQTLVMMMMMMMMMDDDYDSDGDVDDDG